MDFASPSARTRGNTMRMAGSTAIAEKAFGSVEPASTQHVPEWVPDDTAHSCMLCHSSFTFLSRRHHCRSCGFLVCDSCSHARLLLPLFQAPERVCDRCVNELGEAAEHSITRSVNTRSITRTASSSTAAAPGSGATTVGPALPPRGAGPSSSAVSAFAASTSSTTPFPISAASLPAWAVAFARAVPLFSSSSSSSSSGIGVPVTVGCLLVRPIAARSVSFPAPATAAAVMRAADSAAAKLDLSSSSRGRRPIPGTRTRSGRHQAHLAAAVAAAVTDVCSADMPFFTLSASLGPARAVVGAARARALPFTPPAGSEAALMPSVLSAALAAGAGEAGGAAADADFAAAAAATASAATVSDGGLTFPSEGAVLPVPAASCARVLTLVLCDSKTGAVMGTAQLPLWRLKTGQRVRVTLPLTAPHHHHQHHSASSPAAAAAAAAAAADNAGDASEGGSLTPSASFSRSRSRSSSTASGSKRGCPRITVDVELALAGTAAWWAEATAPDTAGLAAVFAPSQPIGAAVAGAGAGVGAYAAEVETETGSFIAPPAPADSGSASTSATTGDGLLVRSLSANIGEVYYAADSELMGSALPNSASATAATAAAIAAVASTPTALATPKNASAGTGVAPSPSPAPALAALLSDCVHILSLFRPLFFAADAASPLLARRAPVLTVAAAAAALYIALQPWALLPLLLAVALRAVVAGPLTAAVVAARGGSPAASAGAGARGKKEYDDCDSSSDSDDDDDDDDDDVGSTPLSLYGGGSGSSSACSPARVTSLCRQLPGARSDGGDSADAALAAVLTSLLGDLVAPGGAPAAVRGAVVVSRARVAARGIRGAAEAAAGLFKMQRLRGHVHGHAHAHGEKGQWVDVVLPAAAVVLLTVAFLWSLFAPQAPLWAAIVVVAFTINTPVRFAAVAATRAGAKLWRERVARG